MTSSFIIGFATKFYTLWSVSDEPYTNQYGEQIGVTHRYAFIKKISMSRERAQALFPDAPVDNTPRAYMELSVDDLLPMPVTPALLSINGWRVASGGMMVIDLNDNGNKTRFGWKEPGEMIVGYGRVPVYVQHLHHLQNIIRNAGFKDYANNIHLHSI